MDQQFKTSRLHTDEFESGSSYSTFYLREAETGRQTKHNGFLILILGKPRKGDCRFASAPQHCRSIPFYPYLPHERPSLRGHLLLMVSKRRGIRPKREAGGSGWARLHYGFPGKGRAENRCGREGNGASRRGDRTEEGLAVLNHVGRFEIGGLFVCSFGVCGTETRAQGLMCARQMSTMTPLPLRFILTLTFYFLRQGLIKLSCLALNSPPQSSVALTMNPSASAF